MTATRTACVRIPRFPIGAIYNASATDDAAQHWDGLPIALLEGTTLRTLTTAASRTGVRAGMTVAQARSRCASLSILPWDTRTIGREIARTSAAFLAASPQVSPERDTPGLWWIGAEGFDAIGGESGLARALLRIARVWHPLSRVAVADSCVTARAATWSARATQGPVIVPTGEDATYLANIPIALLPMEDEMREALLALGLRTIGALAALDPLDVERRWGSEGLLTWRLARGQDTRRPSLAFPDDQHRISHELAMSTPTIEPVLFLLRPSLDRLVRTLAAEGRAVSTIAITLTLDTGLTLGRPQTVTREVRPARPVARVAPLFERCRALLEQWELPGPICGVEIAIAESAPAMAEQGDLLAGAWRDPAAAEAALDRLRATLGSGSVVRAVLRNSHAPERAGAWEELYESVGTRTQPPIVTTPPTPVVAPAPAARLLESPEAIAVTVDKRGTPIQLHWRGRRMRITSAVGPERLTGEWWHAEPFARDYWRCESEELGQQCSIYRDRNGWFLQGWYD